MMNHSKITYHNIEFLLLEITKVTQKGHSFYIAKAPAKEIVKMFTVSPAEYDIKKYTELSKKHNDEKEYYESIVTNKQQQTDFQRDKDPGRIKKISNYIETNEYAFFPNSIICTVECIEIPENENIEESITNNIETESSTTSYFMHRDGIDQVLIPFVEKSILVIDGQHRLEGLKEFFKTTETEDVFEYDLLLSFFIGFDRAVVAQQFYTINYEQKPVNKSILYHLMGEFSDEIDELTMLHNFIRLLNEYEKSPFHQRIKMLGKTPKNATNRQMYSISQAFFIDELIKTVSSKSLNSLYQPIFLYYIKNKDFQIEVIKFIMRFFNAVKLLRSDWNNPSASILSKGMGVAALIKVMQFMIPVLFLKDCNKDTERLIKLDTESLKLHLKGIENVNLLPFSRQGSAGNITKIKEAFIEKIEFFKYDSYIDFESEFKQTYFLEYKQWNKTNLK